MMTVCYETNNQRQFLIWVTWTTTQGDILWGEACLELILKT